jgi:hypothetical protein
VFEYSKANSVASNSIPNQLALLSGCSELHDQRLGHNLSHHRGLVDGTHTKRIHRTLKCEPRPDGSPRETWLFDVMKRDRGGTTLFGEEFCSEGSKWVMQGNYWPLDRFDYNLPDVFCALQQFNDVVAAIGSGVARIVAHVRYGEDRTWTMSKSFVKTRGFDTYGVCIGGRNRWTWLFWLAREMWAQLPHTPKFAYFNFMVAHTYAAEAPLLEHTDALLENFLRGFLAGPAKQNTVILLRSDHGLQGGSLAPDWSTQIEQRKPWTYLLVPEAVVPASGLVQRHAAANRRRLITSYDFYRTLRGLFDPSGRGGHGPSWAYDLLTQEVPANRSCYDARIPLSFCGLEHEPDDPAHVHVHVDHLGKGRLDYSYEPRFDVCHEDSERPITEAIMSCPSSWPHPMRPSFLNEADHRVLMLNTTVASEP